MSAGVRVASFRTYEHKICTPRERTNLVWNSQPYWVTGLWSLESEQCNAHHESLPVSCSAVTICLWLSPLGISTTKLASSCNVPLTIRISGVNVSAILGNIELGGHGNVFSCNILNGTVATEQLGWLAPACWSPTQAGFGRTRTPGGQRATGNCTDIYRFSTLSGEEWIKGRYRTCSIQE